MVATTGGVRGRRGRPRGKSNPSKIKKNPSTTNNNKSNNKKNKCKGKGKTGTRGKRCFVTVGTTKFEDLIRSVDSEEVRDALVRAGYTNLTLQIGRGEYEPTRVLEPGARGPSALRVLYFDLCPSLGAYMDESDLVISHAGAGSLFEALNAGRRVIAVPNPALMVNHQEELADHLAGKNLLLHAKVEPAAIAEAIARMEDSDFDKYEPQDARTIVSKIDSLV
ncbi:glycosyltransferase [Chloropicon primus]|uniref:Glycosyltransferase n=1 Tax=Chloropicon primus TaxID=1764295 RepID=A0A5B8MTR8_9CHLO|nr:glycosyltransferase [Chloropicon primus]UPR03169.1 glycosyltransferase [Chloropicon primus]|eukprot:QDZ23959.1 glycosyltransferase [Chloropicon primus]